MPYPLESNPDASNPAYLTRTGIYQQGCGLNQVLLSWGHDEYLYHVLRDHLPAEALAIIRYHSFYAAHEAGDYEFLMNDEDRRAFAHVRDFNRFDLYSKTPERSDFGMLRPYYEELVAEFLPDDIQW